MKNENSTLAQKIVEKVLMHASKHAGTAYITLHSDSIQNVSNKAPLAALSGVCTLVFNEVHCVSAEAAHAALNVQMRALLLRLRTRNAAARGDEDDEVQYIQCANGRTIRAYKIGDVA